MDFNLSRIAEVAIRVIRETQLYIQREITEDPDSAFEEAAIGRRQKPLLVIDLVAEKNTAHDLRTALRSYSLRAIGEESLQNTVSGTFSFYRIRLYIMPTNLRNFAIV